MLTLSRNILLLLILITTSFACVAEKDEKSGPGLNEKTLKGLEWRGIGPAMTAGRVADIAISHENRSTWYVAVGSGGIEQNGTYDMMGNIYEHTETWDGGQVVFRGGGYFQSENSLKATWRTTDSITANYETVGLRVAAIPEPSSIAMIGLVGGLGVFIRRRLVI